MDIQKERAACELSMAEGDMERHKFLQKIFTFNEDMSGGKERYNNHQKSYWAGWQAAKAQAVPEGFVLVPNDQIKGYYSHDGDNYQVHETLDQAKSNALSAIEHYSDQLADGNFHPENDGNFQDISFGIVLGKSNYSLIHIVTQQDIDDGESKYPVGTEILELHLDETMIEAAEGK